MEEVSALAAAVGKIPSGLFIVTAASGSLKEGYLGSWIQQVSFSPLLIQTAIRPGRPCYDLIKTHGRFCVNIVGHKNGGILKPFWNPEANPEPFAGLEWSATARGNIVLPHALAALECEVRSTFTPGDHELLFAEVVEGHVFQAEDKSLTHVRRSGLGY
ncbi:MAG TPA: flavin reductase family protein [Fibrobacteria bacterium]|nr:flavin reductase family protein [Fibrobacteria bacterium]